MERTTLLKINEILSGDFPHKILLYFSDSWKYVKFNKTIQSVNKSCFVVLK